jgi:hypothetical protein
VGATKRGPPSDAGSQGSGAAGKPKKRVGKSARKEGAPQAALEEIAALIAGAGSGEARITHLSASIKQKKAAKKAGAQA